MCFWAGCFGILGDELIFQGHCYISVGTAVNGIANFKLQTGPQTAETHPQVALEVISNRCIFQFAMNQFVCQLQAVSIYVLHRWLDDHRHVCRRVFQLKNHEIALIIFNKTVLTFIWQQMFCSYFYCKPILYCEYPSWVTALHFICTFDPASESCFF